MLLNYDIDIPICITQSELHSAISGKDRNENSVTNGKHFELLFYENVMRF